MILGSNVVILSMEEVEKIKEFIDRERGELGPLDFFKKLRKKGIYDIYANLSDIINDFYDKD